MAAKTLMSLAEFERLPDDGMLHELNEGELVKVVHPKFRHSDVAHRIYDEISWFLRGQPLGRVLFEAGYVLSQDPPTLRVPDVSFLSAERLRNVSPDDWIHGAPELAIEVVSPPDSAEDLDQKVRQYLASGTRSVWIVYPRTETVHVHRPNENPVVIAGEERLAEPAILPGWSMTAGDLFPDWPKRPDDSVP